MNRLLLSAELVGKGAVRYTPAGLPALDFDLKHESEVSENGTARRVSIEIKALAIGEITGAVAALALGSSAVFTGFIAGLRNGRGSRFHITSVDLSV